MSTQRGKSKRRPKKSASTAKKTSLPDFEFTDDLLKGKTQGDPGAPAAGKPAAGKPADDDDKKISLPAFGFAEDLLKEQERSGQPVEEKAAKSSPSGRAAGAPAAGAPAAGAPAAGAPAAGAPAAGVPRGEDRVFAFADRLEAGAEEEEQAPARLETWVSFRLAGETFALPVDPVHEVVRPTSITRVPHAPYPIRGVTNLRGRVVPVIDLRLRLELPLGDVTRTSRIVVVGSRGRRLGLLVDAVKQVVHLDVDRVQPPPDDVMTVQSDYISGVYHLGEELILLLDVDRVLIIKEPAPATIDEAGNLGAGAA